MAWTEQLGQSRQGLSSLLSQYTGMGQQYQQKQEQNKQEAMQFFKNIFGFVGKIAQFIPGGAGIGSGAATGAQAGANAGIRGGVNW